VDDDERIGEVDQLGVDEISFQAGNATLPHQLRHQDRRHQGPALLDLIEGRDALHLRKWLAGRSRQWLEAVKVVSVDSHEGYGAGLMRAALVELLTADTTIEIVGEAATGRQAAELAVRLAPEVVLMAVRMPDGTGPRSPAS
jgi:hypothetical protein